MDIHLKYTSKSSYTYFTYITDPYEIMSLGLCCSKAVMMLSCNASKMIIIYNSNLNFHMRKNADCECFQLQFRKEILKRTKSTSFTSVDCISQCSVLYISTKGYIRTGIGNK